jgi:pimeloyl-ACP methyl ester carboxylesterase
MNVELVEASTADGVRLDGYLREASVRSAQLGVDLVICHHGVGGTFYTPSFFDTMGERFLERGSAILRVNNRGHDQAYHQVQRRLGAAYEVLDDCRRDFTAWLDFAHARGYRRIALWGHSLGAVKTVYFQSIEQDERVVCAIASSPPRFVHQAYLRSEHGSRFKEDIDRAQHSIDQGEPESLLEALIPQARAFSARTYLDKYGPGARFDYFQYLPTTRVPLMLTLGGLEVSDVSFKPLADRGPTMHADWPRVSFNLIDGADHGYTDRHAELWTAAQAWFARCQGTLTLEQTPIQLPTSR